MMQVSRRGLVVSFLVGVAAYCVLVPLLAANPQTSEGLDHLVPREKWEEAGLNKLTVAEQQALAGDIASLLAAARTTENNLGQAQDMSQWRRLQRHMTKDEVKKLLGEPKGVSVSRYAESWYYVNGNVSFDGKGRLDMWSEFSSGY